MTIALALAAAASWGTADFLAGLAGRRLSTQRATVLTVPTSAQVVGLVVSLALLVLVWPADPSLGSVTAAIGAGAANAAGVAALYRGLAVGEMAVVAPIAALVTSVAPVALGLFAGERPTLVGGLGIAVAVLAAVLVSRSPADPDAAPTGHRRSIALGVLAGVGIAGMLVLLGRTHADDVVWTVVLVKAAGLATLAVATVAVSLRKPMRGTLSFRWEVVAVGVLDLCAIAAYQWAATRGLLVVVAVVASLYPVGTVLLARSVLGERLSAPQVSGVALAAGAVALIAAG